MEVPQEAVLWVLVRREVAQLEVVPQGTLRQVEYPVAALRVVALRQVEYPVTALRVVAQREVAPQVGGLQVAALRVVEVLEVALREVASREVVPQVGGLQVVAVQEVVLPAGAQTQPGPPARCSAAHALTSGTRSMVCRRPYRHSRRPPGRSTHPPVYYRHSQTLRCQCSSCRMLGRWSP